MQFNRSRIIHYVDTGIFILSWYAHIERLSAHRKCGFSSEGVSLTTMKLMPSVGLLCVCVCVCVCVCARACVSVKELF
jgi:hypothetical protein